MYFSLRYPQCQLFLLKCDQKWSNLAYERLTGAYIELALIPSKTRPKNILHFLSHMIKK